MFVIRFYKKKFFCIGLLEQKKKDLMSEFKERKRKIQPAINLKGVGAFHSISH